MASTRLSDCEPALQLAYTMLLHDFRESTGHDLQITCTHRSIEEQTLLYAKGRTAPGQRVTNVDGIRTMSNHNYTPARAIDVCVVTQGKVSWSPIDYAPLGELAKRYSLVWGGDWKSLRDYPHLELAEGAAFTVAVGTATLSGASLEIEKP